MKKILFLHSGAEMYGADQILLKLVCNLNKEKFKPIVVLPDKGPLMDILEESGIETKIIEYPIIRRQYFNFKGIFNYIFNYFKSVKEICKFAKEQEIDLIHNNTMAVLEGILVSKKIKKPLITHIHEMIEHPQMISKILYKLLIKNSTKVITVSNAVKKHIDKIIKRNSDNIEVVHNGIEIDKFSAKLDIDYLYDEFNIPKTGVIVLGMIGRINAIKGQDDFINVMHRILKRTHNIYGIIVGDAFRGQEWRIKELEKKIKKCNCESNLIYTGFRKDIKQLHQLFDIYILPSIEKDSFPTVVLESMASGNSIVAYKCGGVEEMVIDNTNGFLVEQRNDEELLKAIQVLSEDIELRKKMGQKSYEIVKKEFSIEGFIKKFEKLYSSLE